MVAKRGDTFIEGIDVIIKRDLDKHQSLLDKNNMDIQSLTFARQGEIDRKRFYNEQKGKRKYKDDAMDKAISQMVVNIAHLSNQIFKTKEHRVQNAHIVDTLTAQLADYNKSLLSFYKSQN